MGKASKVGEGGLVTIVGAQAQAGKALVPIMKTLIRVTRVATKARGVVTKVRWVMALVMNVGKGGEARPSTT